MSSSQVQTVVTGWEKARWALALLLALFALASFYVFDKQSQLLRWGALLVGLALAVGVFFTSVVGRGLLGFAAEAWREVGKVVWPERREAIQVTLYVFAFVFVMALFLWLTDKALEWLLYDLILGWRK